MMMKAVLFKTISKIVYLASLGNLYVSYRWKNITSIAGVLSQGWLCTFPTHPVGRCYQHLMGGVRNARPCHGTSFPPASSYPSGSCLSVSYRPLTYVSSCSRPSGLLPCGYRPSGSLPCGFHPISIVSSGLRPLRPVFSGCQTLPYVFSPYRPSCST